MLIRKSILSFSASLAFAFCSLTAQAQVPQKMSYQAVVRNASQTLLTNQEVGMRLSILQGSATGAEVYSETHLALTNANGLVTVELGNGTDELGSFGSINWSQGPYFIQSEVDPSGGSNYTIIATSQLLSVPYALYAETSGSSIPGPQGPAGAQGATGVDGVQGPNGPQGPAGPQGVAGPAGADGTSVEFQGSVTSASELPTSGVTIGAGYISQDNGHLWVWDGANWVDAGSIQGPQGAAGPQGLQGPQGAQGEQGPAGAVGAQGPAGPQGIAGADGAQGPAGPTGVDGVQGPQGMQGPQGPAGAAGPQGSQGVAGAQGVAGEAGPQGAIGPQGAAGSQGPQGPQGPAGADGTSISIQGSAATENDLPTSGNNGDGYIVQSTGFLWIWDGSDWIEAGNIQGPAGPVGPAGAQGPAGPQGAAGVAGAQGPAGAQGDVGAQGAVGPAGPIGPMGPQGADGQQGSVGPAGPAGAQGPAGPQGAAGAAGPQGPAGTEGASGTNGTNGTNGVNGTNGQNSLVKTTTEPAANNCPNGGVKLEYGLDANGNGTLDSGEINASLTKYVCNGAAGANGAAGPQGVAGPQGTTGIVSIGAFSGSIGSISNGNSYVFAGPTTTVQINSLSQRITGSAVASLSLLGQLPSQEIVTGLCFQGSDGAITNFVGGNYTISRVTSTLIPYAAAASVTNLPAGSYNVGYCVLNVGANTLGANDYANGWVMVTE